MELGFGLGLGLGSGLGLGFGSGLGAGLGLVRGGVSTGIGRLVHEVEADVGPLDLGGGENLELAHEDPAAAV